MRYKQTTVKTMLAILIPAILITLLTVSPVFGAVSPVEPGAQDSASPALGANLPIASVASRVWTDESNGVQVLVEGKSLYSPPKLDRQVAYPNELNYIPYLRYSLNGSSGETADLDALLVCLSGMHAGNNGFDYFSKQLVSKAKADRNMNIEVWAIDRRANNLEDLTGLNEAERLGHLAAETGDISYIEQAADAIDGYYYGGLAIDGKTFQGFYTNENAPYLSEFGLRVAMEDIYTLIKTAYPDPNERKQKVYVAGDSLGAVITADFACWDFDGNPNTTDDAGYNNVAGVIALDALMTPNAIPINQDVWEAVADYLPQSMRDLINTTSLGMYDIVLNMVRNGTIGVMLPTSEIGYVPTTYLGVEVTAMMADALPDQESDFYARTAQYDTDPRSDMILRIAMSKDLRQFLSGEVWQKKVRWTNEALFGICFDNNFNPICMNESAMGFLTGGPIAEKSFPAIGNLDARLPSFIWNPISGFMPYDKMYIPTSTTALYRWVNSDEIDSDPTARRYTSCADEVSDMHDVAKCAYEGPSNIAEWYYTTRLFADIMIANTPGASNYGLNLIHQDQLAKVPTFIRLNKEGTNIGYAKMNGMNTRGIELPGQHLDVLMMDMDRSPTLKNLMYLPMCDWMKTTSGNVAPAPAPEPGPDPTPQPQPSLAVTAISPNSGSRYSWSSLNVEVSGTGFTQGASVKLERGRTVINASNVTVVSSGKITCRLSLFFKSRGTYDVVVTNKNGEEARLAGAFTVR